MKKHKKYRLRGNADGLETKVKGIHMEYITKKPIAQGILKYGHFLADVKVYSSSDVRFDIGMSEKMSATIYDEYYDRVRWVQMLETEMSILRMRIEDYAWKVLRGEYIPTDWGLENAL